jgi:L-ascorbate metabolism protein UlaG (beta-lactamase superfamily)
MTLSGLGTRTRVCAGGETVRLGDGAAVTMIRSAHGFVSIGKGVPFDGELRAAGALPMKARGYRVGTVFAPLLELDGRRFLHVGSANFDEAQMQGHACDVLFLCAPGWKRRQGYPQRIIEMTRPRTVVLFHYDNFSKPHAPGSKTRAMPLTDIPGMIRTIQRTQPSVAVLVPDLGEAMTF